MHVLGRLAPVCLHPASARARRWFVLVVCVALAGLAFANARSPNAPVFPVDDAYITLHNAITLRAGTDASYVGVPALVGATSAVHVVLVAGLLTVLPPLWALWASCWAGTFAYALGLLRLATVNRASPIQAGLLVTLGLVVGQAPHQLTNGLETSLAMAGVAWGLALVHEEGSIRSTALPVLLGTLPFVRPELGVFSLLIAAYLLRRVRRSGEPGAVRFVAFLALGAVPWVLFYLATTGAPFPNTMQAKRFFFAEGCAPAAVKLDVSLMMLRDFAASLGLTCIGLTCVASSATGRLSLFFVLVLVAAYFIALPGALGHYENRYLYILVPMLLDGVAASFRHSARWVRAATWLTLVAGAAESMGLASARWQRHLDTIRFTTNELMPLATWANEHLPSDARLLVHDAGFISWATHFRLFDVVGLKTPTSIPFHREHTWRACVEAPRAIDLGALSARVNLARATAIGEIAKLDRPTHLVMLRRWEDIYGTVRLLRTMGWALDPLREGPYGYDVYRLQAPR